MKKSLLLAVCTIANCFLPTAYSFSQGAWTQKANFGGTARDNAVGFSIGTKGYIGTGNDGIVPYKRQDFWEWDQSTNVWTQKANFIGTARYGAVGFSIGSKGYIGTGDDGTPKKDFWEYDPSSNTWNQKANFGGTARENAVGFSIGNKGYIGTGDDGSGVNQKDFWEWNQATNIWTQKANFGGTARSGAVGFSIGTKGYIGTGNDGGLKQDFWEWNQATNTWTPKANFGGTARQKAVGFSIGTQGYIGTGHQGAVSYYNYCQDFWAWNQATNTWTQKANFGGAIRSSAVGFSIGTQGYIGTGYNYGAGVYNNFWEFDPNVSSCIWDKKADFGGLARSKAVGFSIGTKGYIGTGADYITNVVFQDFWECDQANNVWTQKANFGGTARYNAVGFSIGTKGYIGTGWNGPGAYYQDFWEWDQATNVWTPKANFGGTARWGAVGFSIGTKGYIGTGDATSGFSNDFWEWDQATNVWTPKANFGGTTRREAVGFSIGTKGYIGTGYGPIPYFFQDFWEWDQATNIWAQKANFGGGIRHGAVGFSIGNKGYIGTGNGNSPSQQRDFWEWDQSSNMWTQKVNFGGTTRAYAVGFSIGTKGYIGTGNGISVVYQDFWEYNSALEIPPAICLITVDSLSKNNIIIWDKTQFVYTTVNNVTIYRDTANNNYAPIAIISNDSLSQFIDTVRTLYAANGDPNISSWRYKIAIEDMCGNFTPLSPYHQSIFIQNISGNFLWNHYQIEGQPQPVPALTNYLFQRDNLSNGSWFTIGTLGASSTAFTDPQYSTFQNTASWNVRTAWSISCTPQLHEIPDDEKGSNPNPMGTINTTKSNSYKTSGNAVNENVLENWVNVYPNPFAETAALRITNGGELRPDIIGMKLFDVMGQEHKIEFIRNSGGYVIRSGGLANGIYFLKVISDNGTAMKKVVVAH